MQTTLKVDSEWVLLHLEGTGTSEELKEVYEKAVAMAESSSVPRILLDSRESRIHPDFDGMRDLAAFALSLRRSPLPRTALIVAGNFEYGLARMFGSLIEFSDWEFRIFREAEPATRWLMEKTTRPS